MLSALSGAVLPPGLHFALPYPLETMRIHDLKERPYHLEKTPGITRDNVDLVIDGVVYLRIVDAYRANYAVADPIMAMLILAQTTVRSKIGEMTLDQTFKNREELNAWALPARDRPGHTEATHKVTPSLAVAGTS